VNNIVREIKEKLIVVFLNRGIDMDREAAIAPGTHFINQSITDTIMVFKHFENFFAEDKESLRGIKLDLCKDKNATKKSNSMYVAKDKRFIV